MWTPAEQLQMVIQALTLGASGVSNCVEWRDDKTANQVRSDPANRGLTPEWIRQELLRQVASNPALVEQRPETREPWCHDHEFYYRVVLVVPGFARGLFVEMVLDEPDLEVPAVSLVNAHPQR